MGKNQSLRDIFYSISNGKRNVVVRDVEVDNYHLEGLEDEIKLYWLTMPNGTRGKHAIEL